MPSDASGPSPRLELAALLAGGGSRRMGGDKAEAQLAGRRLIDHVLGRLALQAHRIVIAGPHAYGTGLTAVPDRADAPAGPVGAIWSVAHWCRAAHLAGFATAPVDAPFLPLDLLSMLALEGGCALAADETGLHPTFGWWQADQVIATIADDPHGRWSLHRLAAACAARAVPIAAPGALANINTPADLAAAAARLHTGPASV